MSQYQKQANAFLTRHGIKFKFLYIECGPYFENDKESRNIYRLTLIRQDDRRKRYSTRFGASVHMTLKGIDPTAYDLLACLTKNDPGTFKDFCNEYGYDTDSISASRTYHKVRRDWVKVQDFFTEEEMKELYDIN